MDNTVVVEENKPFILIPEDLLLSWIEKYSQEQINTNTEILSRVRAYQRVQDEGILLYQEEIIISEENPEQEKFKQWITP